MMNVATLILANGDSSAPAVWHRDAVLTHGELRSLTIQCAKRLLEHGHTQGERIGILAENSFTFITAYFGIIYAGMVAVPLPVELKFDAFAQITSTSGIKCILASSRQTIWLNPLAEQLGLNCLSESDWQTSRQNPDARLVDGDQEDELASLMFTSGSTGAPKGVMLSHRNIASNSRDIVNYLELKSTDKAMAILPFHYCFGLSLLHTYLLAGGSVVLNNEFKLFPESVLKEMIEKECTGFAGVPSTYQILLRNSRFRLMSFPKLKLFQQAGGKLPNSCIEELRESFPSTRFYLMYGQTEATARLSYLPPDLLNKKMGSVGKGLASTRLEVLNEHGIRVKPGSDEIGEIVASGKNIAAGYWNDPVETAKFFRNGKLHTGDLARVDKDGFIYIVERAREMIKSGGNRISPKEVEDIIAEILAVVEVAVVGIPHAILGECVIAFVVASKKGDVDVRSILAHCHRRLPAHKVPEEIIFVHSLPHNSSGKVLKSKLKEMAGKRRSPVVSHHFNGHRVSLNEVNIH